MGTVIGYEWEHSMDISGELGLLQKGIITASASADLIAERIKLLPSYGRDAELSEIVHSLQEETASAYDVYDTLEWLKDWGDHGRRLFIKDFGEEVGPIA